MVSEPIPTQSTAKVSSLISTSVPLTGKTFHVPSPPPSPTITSTPISTPITVATCPNVSVGVSQPQISVAQTTPLYTDSTTTTTATSSPPVTVNVFDTGTDFHYSRFTIHQESDDDDAPMTKGQFKALNKKLDTLLESSKSSSNNLEATRGSCHGKTEKVKVLFMKLSQANKQIDDLNSEKAVVKSCVADVNLYLQNLVETCDSLLMFPVGQHLVEKLKPVFSMLNRIEGVLESDALLKQRGKAKKPSNEEPKNTVDDSGEFKHKTQPKTKD
ncbi:uncharacterized protein LOC111912141 [Lactuca sativa]|uniref:uncharacterized protein LOC111912141 n=1 Tax=Lactuca sativa TaxID=4236 RepID=UPI000CD914A4|nr:uncharacterized protein LOC111912141 [Lactuca sativa]